MAQIGIGAKIATMNGMRDKREMNINFEDINFDIGWVRYEGLFKGNYIIIASDTYYYDIRTLVDNLNGGDNDAMEAASILKELEKTGDVWIESNNDPSIAMFNLCLKLNKVKGVKK